MTPKKVRLVFELNQLELRYLIDVICHGHAEVAELLEKTDSHPMAVEALHSAIVPIGAAVRMNIAPGKLGFDEFRACADELLDDTRRNHVANELMKQYLPQEGDPGENNTED